jgi:hypothetical protein
MREFIGETVGQLGAKTQLKIMKFYESLVVQGVDDCTDAGGTPNRMLGDSAASGTSGCRVTQDAVTEGMTKVLALFEGGEICPQII